MSIIARRSSVQEEPDEPTILPAKDWLDAKKINARWEAAAKAARVAGDVPKHRLGLETSATDLMKYAYKGDVVQLKRLLDEDSSEEYINAQDEFGWTAVRYAIRNNKAAAAKMLAIDFKADINLASKSGSTPLMSAARNGLEEMVKGLVNAGADVTAVDEEGLTALDYAQSDAIKATITGDVKEPEEVPVWVNKGWEAKAKVPLVSANIPKHKLGVETTKLMRAALEGDNVMMKILLEEDSSEEFINAQDEFGWTALRYAVRSQNAAAARLLAVDFKADINLASTSGSTPLMAAARNNLVEMVTGLVNCGADITAVDNEGLTAYDYAISDAIKAMVDLSPGEVKEPTVPKKLPRSETYEPIAFWARKGNEPKVSADIPKHALGLESSATPLMKAAWKGDTVKMNSLLTGTRGEKVVEDINEQDEFGWTALRYAVRNQKADAARMLAVTFKADVNLASNSGRTPLMSAAGNNLEEMVKGLVNSGADITAVDNEGLTAFDHSQTDAIKAMVDPANAKEPEVEKEPAESWEEATEKVSP